MHPSIRLEGSILSADILDAIERGERAHQLPKDLGLDPSTKVKKIIRDRNNQKIIRDRNNQNILAQANLL